MVGELRMIKKYDILSLNCYQSSAVKLSLMQKRGEVGALVIGWAIGPDGERYSHTWIETEAGEIIDLCNWTDHQRETTISMPDQDTVDEFVEFLHDNYPVMVIQEAFGE